MSSGTAVGLGADHTKRGIETVPATSLGSTEALARLVNTRSRSRPNQAVLNGTPEVAETEADQQKMLVTALHGPSLTRKRSEVQIL